MNNAAPSDDTRALRPAPHSRYPSLDLWRGVACLAVVFFHSTVFCDSVASSHSVASWIVAITARGWIGAPGFRSPAHTLLMTVPLCVTAALIAAWLFHQTVERRFLNPSTSKLQVVVPPSPAPVEG